MLGTPQVRKFGINVGSSDIVTQPFPMYTPFNLNVHTYEPMTASANHLGYPLNDGTMDTKGEYHFDDNEPIGIRRGLTSQLDYVNTDIVNGGFIGEGKNAIFNAIILSRQGPYGWPSWKQTRGAEHPVVIDQRKNSTLTIVDAPKEYIIQSQVTAAPVAAVGVEIDNVPVGSTILRQTIRGLSHGNSITRYSEPAVVYNCPMTHIINNRTLLRHTYRNNMCLYSNTEINNRLGLSEHQTTMYDKLVEGYTEINRYTRRTNLKFDYLAYCEGVYP